MKLISQSKIGDIVEIEGGQVEIIRHHIAGCLVKPVKINTQEVLGNQVAILPTSANFQISNWTEIKEG